MAESGGIWYPFSAMKTPSNTRARRPQPTAPESRTLPGPAWPADAPSEHDRDVAVLAHAVWEKNGCPPGRQRQYWHEVEAQLRATRHWLEQDLSSRASPGPDASPVGAP